MTCFFLQLSSTVHLRCEDSNGQKKVNILVNQFSQNNISDSCLLIFFVTFFHLFIPGVRPLVQKQILYPMMKSLV